MTHIAFALEQAYGHILPTLGIAIELIKRGNRVSYVVTRNFSVGVKRIGANALTFEPLVTRPAMLESINDRDEKVFGDLRLAKTENSMSQLEMLFRKDPPDLIVHDAIEDFAARSLALRWGIPHVRFCPAPLDSMVEVDLLREFAEDSIVLVAVPRFFSDSPPMVGNTRVEVVGFIPEGRNEFFEPWRPSQGSEKTILASVTTGIMPQVEFCRIVIEAFRNEPYRVVLSIGGLDEVSRITPSGLGDLPDNVVLNQGSSNFDILRNASLLITQGGQGSVLEALFHGVPVLGVPSYRWDEEACQRIVELGLGSRLDFANISAYSLRGHFHVLLNDHETLSRVRKIRQQMQEVHGAKTAADVIEKYLH